MSKLLPITIISILFAWISHRLSDYDYVNKRYAYHERFWFILMTISLILFVGLRYEYNDTGTYEMMYNAIPSDINLFKDLRFDLGENPGFVLTNRILKRLNCSTQSYLMFYAIITLSIYSWFFRKYSCDFTLTIFLFFTLGIFTFTLAAIKQCVAIAFGMLSIDAVLQKRYFLYCLYLLIGALFHPYVLMLFIIPLLKYRPWSRFTVLLTIAFLMLGFTLDDFLGTILSLTDAIGEEYTLESFTGEGINPLRLLVIAVPTVLSFFLYRQISNDKDQANYLMVNLSMLNAGIMFVGLFGTANYFARLANYFLPFQTIAIPWLLKHFASRTRITITMIAVVCYSLFFVYSNAINDQFDYHYYSITVWEYIKRIIFAVMEGNGI